MTRKDLVILLIQQDLKHHQLLTGLEKSGLIIDKHHLSIIDAVAALLNILPEHQSDQWCRVYYHFQQKAHNFKITYRGDELGIGDRVLRSAFIRLWVGE